METARDEGDYPNFIENGRPEIRRVREEDYLRREKLQVTSISILSTTFQLCFAHDVMIKVDSNTRIY